MPCRIASEAGQIALSALTGKRGNLDRGLYSVEPDAILVPEIFKKSTRQTPRKVKETCRKRVREYQPQDVATAIALARHL